MTDQDQQFRPRPAPQPVPQGATSTAPQSTLGGPAGSAGSAVPAPPESPFAGQLPGWDLLPPASLLLRRRPAR